uniref:Uncharacterized protein n=1 Tax=Magallana gigas TaxID=29159 RepID=A0A8W8KTC2_MAGGI
MSTATMVVVGSAVSIFVEANVLVVLLQYSEGLVLQSSVCHGYRGRASNAKRKFSGKARLPGVKRKCKAVDPDKAQETTPNHGRAGPSTTTDLEDVVSSVAEGMIPELNKTIETIISKRLDITKGSHVSLNQSATCNNQHSIQN